MSIRLFKIKYKSKWRPDIAQIGPVGCRQDHGSEGTTMSILEGDRHGLYPRFAPRTARLPTCGAWSHADKGCRGWSFCATIALHRQICLSCYTPTDPQTLPSLARLFSGSDGPPSSVTPATVLHRHREFVGCRWTYAHKPRVYSGLVDLD